MNALAGLGLLWNSIQTWLFPMLEDELGELASEAVPNGSTRTCTTTTADGMYASAAV